MFLFVSQLIRAEVVNSILCNLCSHFSRKELLGYCYPQVFHFRKQNLKVKLFENSFYNL